MRTADTTRHDRKTCTRCGDEWDEILDVCHSCAGALVMWLSTATKGTWRIRARQTIRAVVNANRELATTDPDALLKLVDAAYPFGERAMHPYKAWLAERKILRDVLRPPNPATQPTIDDYGACLAAIDLVELGRVDEARQLLDDQAPNRLGRKCPACGAKPGDRCHDGEAPGEPFVVKDVLDDGSVEYVSHPTTVKAFRIVPHIARVEPKQPAPMPLFERSRT